MRSYLKQQSPPVFVLRLCFVFVFVYVLYYSCDCYGYELYITIYSMYQPYLAFNNLQSYFAKRIVVVIFDV